MVTYIRKLIIFKQINFRKRLYSNQLDGMGIHILGNGRCEAVSVFVYYVKSVFAESGGFIRGLNCSHAYGEKAVLEFLVQMKTKQ